MSLLYKNKLNYGYTEIIGKDVKELEYLTLGIVRLKAGEIYSAKTEGEEVGLVIMGGTCTVKTENKKWTSLGKRLNVFDGKATAVYVPCKSSYTIKAETEVEVAVCGALAEEKKEPQVIRPEDIVVNQAGKLNWQRDVQNIFSKKNSDTQRLIVGETYNKSGNWSSYPPHKHDIDNLPEEVNLEEVYHFRVNPGQGFGIQKVYTSDRSLDETYTVENKNTVIIPNGYHPVAAAPGYELYYLWILAGETRVMRPNDDPEHLWVKAVEKMVY